MLQVTGSFEMMVNMEEVRLVLYALYVGYFWTNDSRSGECHRQLLLDYGWPENFREEEFHVAKSSFVELIEEARR
jgi:hypothetical protein